MSGYHLTGINWDTDDDPTELGLPEDALIYAADPEDIADLLSDEFGWCVLDFHSEPMKPKSVGLAK